MDYSRGYSELRELSSSLGNLMDGWRLGSGAVEVCRENLGSRLVDADFLIPCSGAQEA